MTEVSKAGELIECSDEAIHEFIYKLNADLSDPKKFIIRDLPPRHVFVKKGSSARIKEAINEMINTNTFTEENRKVD